MSSRWSYAMICSSNMNRSMEAHKQMALAGMRTRSFGTGTKVRLPGLREDRPMVYGFGMSYQDIHGDLCKNNETHFRNNGLLNMLERNMKIKRAPERWQEQEHHFDVLITFEERVFDNVVTDLHNRSAQGFNPIIVINRETKDRHEESVIAARDVVKLCCQIERAEDMFSDIENIMQAFEKEAGYAMLYNLFIQ